MLKKEGIRFKYVNEGEKDMSIKQRAEIANAYARKYGVESCLGISIHSDGFHDKAAHGWSCYTSKGQTMSDEYAESLYRNIIHEFPGVKVRVDISDGDPDISALWQMLLTETPYPRCSVSTNQYLYSIKVATTAFVYLSHHIPFESLQVGERACVEFIR